MNNYNPNFVPPKNYFIVGQKAVISSQGGKFLLLKRSDKSGAGGKWSLPGGALEHNEDPFEGMQREVHEETELEVTNLLPFQIRSYPNKDDFVIIIGYHCTTVTLQPKLNWEHTAYEWVTKEEALTKDLTLDARFFIEAL